MLISKGLYVCQYLKGKIVKVDPSGKTETVTEGISGPSAVAFGITSQDSNKLYILEKGANMKFNGTYVLVLPL